MVGISRRPKDFSAVLFAELWRHGYEALPVNPNVTEVMGRRCYALLNLN
jgi:predicted CoA-binding protein